MINTQQISLELGPPYLNMSHPDLATAPLPSQHHGKSLTRVLVVVVVLHVFLSVGGFIFLYRKDRMLSIQLPSSKQQETTNQQHNKAFARMVVEDTWNQKPIQGYLKWDLNHSFRRNIGFYRNSWLTILQPGDYYVYSRVTFSKGATRHPLVSRVMLRRNETGEGTVPMKAYCNLDRNSESASIPHLCTATQGEVIPLERGNQLGVWVPDFSLVNYEEGATAFGLYKLD
ncbi:tumor necrosis factor ligand superfamily member 6-like [Anoplopoma fimbria]|uniref:tumor necrosis factor ligand superfamily member 6-like n=1 Tax=Anoplopoma fimbria TaxID=229290 RepID=UPI0023EBBEE4|nr:tumor necrosis factor ligand superfamily member 6-like [Anoplopoma fimbria]